MNIKEFLERYGQDTTTNFQLLRWSKDLNIPNFKVLMRNELEKLNKLKSRSSEAKPRSKNKLPIYIICNYQTTKDKGSHWICMFKDNNQAFYFDSYGIQIFQEAIDFLEDGVYSNFKIQPSNSKICGVLCMFILYKLSKGEDFYKTVLDLNDHFNN
jgi:hypothetical protein